MIHVIRFVTVALFLNTLNSSRVCAVDPSGRNIEMKTFAGSIMREDVAYKQAHAVLEATIIDEGLMSPGAPGRAWYEGVKIEVVQSFKGQLEGEISVDVYITSFPVNVAESPPKKGDRIIVFLGGDGAPSNLVRKILLATPENKDSIQRIKTTTESIQKD